MRVWTPCFKLSAMKGVESHYFQVPLCGYHKKLPDVQDCGGQMCELPDLHQ